MAEVGTEKFYSLYKDAGFHFPTSVLTTYALSLSTKPLVILSGISGTGKTKIAQLFDIPTIDKNKAVPVTPQIKISIKVKAIFDRFNFKHDLLPELLTGSDLNEFNQKAKEYSERGDNSNFTNTYILTIEDDFGEFKIGIYGQRAESPLIRARFHKSNRDKGEDYDARDHLREHYNIGDVLNLKKISDKKFKVINVNDQDTVKEINDYEFETLKRKRFISVRSDWTDNSELFGYYNLIEKKYHIPYFLDFVLTAMNHPEHPFFLILDEMNLSKVEHYFSDVLSCLESRIQINGEVEQEKIVLYDGLEELETDSEDYENIPNSIELPLNLYITGTVNIDESTYMFSPKVLDRANVIEFNEVDLMAYGTGNYIDDDDYKLESFPTFTNLTLASKSAYQNLPEEIKKYLVDINNILKENNLHFGYRSANEVALYIKNAREYINDSDEILFKALDHQLIQKIFPKLNGGYAVLEEPLRELLLYLSETDNISKINIDAVKFPKTVSKLLKMHKTLLANGYTSFID